MNLLLKKLRTASRFSPSEWKVIFLAYLFLLKARGLIFLGALSSVEAALAGLPVKNNSLPSSLSQKELSNYFRLALRYQFPRPKCLAAALAEQLFWAHYGYRVTFRIGVQKEGEEFLAHAWCDERENRFSPLEVPGP